MKIVDLPIKKIKPAQYNPRKNLKPGDPAYDRLKKSLETFDAVEPLVWNERSGNLVSGHQRLKILKDRGDKTVTCSVVNLSDRDEKVLNVALNKHGGEWDFATLADVLEELDTGDIDMELTGFDESELARIASWIPPAPEPEPVPGEQRTGASITETGPVTMTLHFASEADRQSCAEILGLEDQANLYDAWWPPHEKD